MGMMVCCLPGASVATGSTAAAEVASGATTAGVGSAGLASSFGASTTGLVVAGAAAIQDIISICFHDEKAFRVWYVPAASGAGSGTAAGAVSVVAGTEAAAAVGSAGFVCAGFSVFLLELPLRIPLSLAFKSDSAFGAGAHISG